MPGKVLIVGASGVVGSSAVASFAANGWDMVAVSRRRPDVDARFEHLPLDLLDAAACQAALGARRDLSHVVFAALFEKPGLVAGWQDDDQMQTNLAMLRNAVGPLAAGEAPLQHVSLLQGTKAYGFHLHAMSIPARESEPRDPHANFYWLQEDWLKEQAKAKRFGWTVFRPQMVVGGAVQAAMNLAVAIGVYGAICRETGEPFGFPGGPSFVWEASDARIVAGALEWAARAPAARDQHFNVTNGDVFEWRNAWPAIAACLGLPAAPDRPLALGTWLPQQAATWERIVRRHDLRPMPLPQLLGESHFCADLCFGTGLEAAPPPAFVSSIKLRQAGYTAVVDTTEMFTFWLQDLARRRIIPSA